MMADMNDALADNFSPDFLKAKLEAIGINLSKERMVVAVSGGADSLALTLAAAELGHIIALTVDHQLRAASTGEARKVHEFLRSRGVEHHILPWEGEKPEANLQAEARGARYALLENWCYGHGIKYLLTAHHMNDQAETFLLRLARGSGVYGLAAMEAKSEGFSYQDVTLIRPLLGVPKVSLEAYLQNQNIDWIEDPSNINDRYDRVKVRNFLTDPVVDGFTVNRLAATADRLARARKALSFYEEKWVTEFVRFDKYGCASFPVDALSGAPEEIILHALADLIRRISGSDYPPRFEKLYRLYEKLCDDGFSGSSLMGALIQKVDNDILIMREVGKIDHIIKIHTFEDTVWDRRFKLCFDVSRIKHQPADETYEIRALAEGGWRELITRMPDVKSNEEISAVAYRVKLSLPAVFDASGLRAVPHLGYNNLENIKINVSNLYDALSKK